jgi:DAK2 domain fusion protein YloV
MMVIKGKTLRDALISGANNVTNQRQQVDALNVFPVPDGDTGTNMSMTIGAAKRELELMADNARVDEVAQTAASALLRGARGNSGVILSLLFRGFSKGLAGKKTASAADMAAALSMGVDAAYKAVMKPTEGTILTVSRMAAEKAREMAEKAPDDMVDMWNQVVAAAAETLEKTPDLLPVLKKAGVVDAGGKGYLAVLEGMRATFVEGVVLPLDEGGEPTPVQGQPAYEDHFDPDYDEEMTFTYCTEFIVERSGGESDVNPLREALEGMGDSLVVVEDDEIIKVHLHTDNPGDALQAGLGYGMLSKIKIENMHEQVERRRSGAKKAAPVPQPQGEETPAFAYRPVDEDIDYGFVAVGAGEGIFKLFADLGVDNMVAGGQTMNPSTDDILSAIQATPAKTVMVLPNNKNIIMAAEQAARLADRQVDVLPTTSIPQGLAAMLAFDPDASVDDNHIAMMHAAEHVGTGQITYAARDSDYDGKKIKEGELLALENGRLAFTAKDIEKAVIRLAKMLLKSGKDHSFVTLLSGEDVDEAVAANVEAALREKLPADIELAHIRGGQPVYYFILSVD